jgi:nucleotide sugar dehydrogenase
LNTGTSLKVAVIGLGKIGLPLAAQFASKGAAVFGCDIDEVVVGAVNRGECPVSGEPGLAEAIAAASAQGRLRATTNSAVAVAESDVIVVIVPVSIDGANRPDFRHLDAAAAAAGPGLAEGKLVILESTVPVGTTRRRFARALADASGLPLDAFEVAYSPERVSSGRIFRDLATYPKVVGGLTVEGGARAADFYRQVLDADVTLLPDAETAEFTKLAESVYRDVNIALANELAQAAESLGVDYAVAAKAAYSQPYSHLHVPGVGVGGHCIPVYPYFLLETTSAQTLVSESRRINDAMAGYAVDRIEEALTSTNGEAPGLRGKAVLILGIAYRDGVKEAAFSSTFLLARAIESRGGRVLVHDPLFSDDEVRALKLTPTSFPPPESVSAVILQAAHADYRDLDVALLPGCQVFLDGRGALDPARFEKAGIRYLRIGLGGK